MHMQVKEKKTSAVGPVLLGFFLFVVVGSGETEWSALSLLCVLAQRMCLTGLWYMQHCFKSSGQQRAPQYSENQMNKAFKHCAPICLPCASGPPPAAVPLYIMRIRAIGDQMAVGKWHACSTAQSMPAANSGSIGCKLPASLNISNRSSTCFVEGKLPV